MQIQVIYIYSQNFIRILWSFRCSKKFIDSRRCRIHERRWCLQNPNSERSISLANSTLVPDGSILQSVEEISNRRSMLENASTSTFDPSYVIKYYIIGSRIFIQVADTAIETEDYLAADIIQPGSLLSFQQEITSSARESKANHGPLHTIESLEV